MMLSVLADQSLEGQDSADKYRKKTVVSWGLGADSTAIIFAFCDDPVAHGLLPDLSDLIVVVALTGDEWPNTMDLCEEYVLPLLAQYNVRLVQVSRRGPLDEQGIQVLSDSRQTKRLFRHGDWTQSQEMRVAGTVPQFAARRRTCSIRFKGWVIDLWTAGEFGLHAYRHVIGYELDEPDRAERDHSYASPTRMPWHPLIEWGFDRPRIQRFFVAKFGFEWPKSYCVQCPFPVSRAALGAHLARCRQFPELTAAVLRMEHTALALNPRSTLYAEGSLLSLVTADANTAALDAFEASLAASRWSVYEVRRIYFAARTRECRRAHGKTCRVPARACRENRVVPSALCKAEHGALCFKIEDECWQTKAFRSPACRATHGVQCSLPAEECRDPEAKGLAWRSVHTVYQGERDQCREFLERRADEEKRPTATVDGITRLALQEVGLRFPTAERCLVVAPVGVADKAREFFENAWERIAYA